MKRRSTMAILAVTGALMVTGCGVGDFTDNSTDIDSVIGGSGTGEGSDTFTIQKRGTGFVIHWSKHYSGYSEIIYTDGNAGKRGNGYPFTNNVTGNYTMTCEYSSETSSVVHYSCSRPDISMRSGVTLKKNVTYQWMVSYGFDHDHGETQATMEYTGGILSIN